VMRAAERIFQTEGSDAWLSRPVHDFTTPALRCPACGEGSFEKEQDVLDVWFDSGISQAAVLGKRPELAWPADAYLEAVEQARGWFGSSLACAVAERGQAPFREVISHGLTVDEQGRKMSKSLGNSEDAADAVNRIGADVLRLVYASLDYTAEVALGDTIYSAVSESYRKIRNTCRYVLGNLADFDPAHDAPALEQMAEFDRYILARLERLKADVRAAYEAYDFQAAYYAIVNFVVIDLSSLYIDVARDRLYCSAAESVERRSVQAALYHVLDTLVRILAPLIPYTADEVYAHMPGKRAESVHLLTLREPNPQWADAQLDARWERLLKIRNEGLKLLEAMRQAGTIGAPLEAAVRIGTSGAVDDGVMSMLIGYREVLKELLIVSDVAPLDAREAEDLGRRANGAEAFNVDGVYGRILTDPPMLLVGRRAPGLKCQRCWCYYDDGGDPELCPRCRSVVRPRAA
jgi:isoleucyl-tRNA synthetase